MIDCGRRAIMRVLAGPAFFRFAAVGAITTSLDLLLFAALTLWHLLPPMAANVLSYSCGIALSFALNRIWTFGRTGAAGSVLLEAVKFLLSNAAGLILSTGSVFLLAQLLSPLAAKIVSVPAVLVWNYGMARHWVFKRQA